MSMKAGVFALNTATGNQTVTVPGWSGITPCAVLFITSTKMTSGGASLADTAMCVGAATGSSERWASSVFDDDPAGSMVSRSRFTSSKCLVGMAAGGAVDWDADFVSFGDGSFTINVTDAPASAYLVYYVVFSGIDAHAGTFSLPTSGTSVAVTGVGFQPDALIGSYGSDAGVDTTDQDLKVGFSFATALAQATTYWVAQDLITTSRITRGAQSGKFVYGCPSASATVDFDAALDTMDSDGFTLSIADNPTTAIDVGFLALGGVEAYVGTETQKTSTGTKAKTGVGFEPEALLVMGMGQTADTAMTVGSALTLYGAAAGGGQFVVTTKDLNGSFNNDSSTYADSSNTYRAQSTGDGAPLALAALDSFDSDGFTLNYSSADATARLFYFLALADGSGSIAAGKIGPATTVRGASLAASGDAPLTAGKIGPATTVRGATPTGSGDATLTAGKIGPATTVRGASLAPSGDAPITAGKIGPATTVRGATPTGSGNATLTAGKIGPATTVRGATVSPSDASITAGKIGPSTTVRGATVAADGNATIAAGKIGPSTTVRGATVSSNDQTLAAGKIGPATTVRGVTLAASGDAPLAVGRISSSTTVRGVTLAASGDASIGAGKIGPSTTVRGATLAERTYSVGAFDLTLDAYGFNLAVDAYGADLALDPYGVDLAVEVD